MINKYVAFSFLFGLCISKLYAQTTEVHESFDDGDFTQNPTWIEDSNKFQISDCQLRLNGVVADTSYCSTELRLLASDTLEWQFWMKHNSLTSNNSYSRVYLYSNLSNLRDKGLEAYYVELRTRVQTQFIFCRVKNGIEEELCKVLNYKEMATNSGQIRVKVHRYPEGSWHFWIDSLGGTDFLHIDSIKEPSNMLIGNQGFMGVWCKYTASDKNKFFFDDILAYARVPDTIPPQVKNAILTPLGIKVYFSEPIDPVSGTLDLHYVVNQKIGNPAYVEYDEDKVLLYYIPPLTLPIVYRLFVSNVSDTSGNKILYPQTVLVKRNISDTDSPHVDTVLCSSKNSIIVIFSEVVDSITATQTDHYMLNKMMGTPEKVQYKNSSVVLEFKSEFQSNIDYELTVFSVSDLSGNGTQEQKVIVPIQFDTMFFGVSSIHVFTPKEIRIVFSKMLNKEIAKATSHYIINQGIGNPDRVECSDSTVVLYFEIPLRSAVDYTLNMYNIVDQWGNSLQQSTFPISHYRLSRNDILINEILFNPYTGGADFVELYNNTQRSITLCEIYLATWDKTNDRLKNKTYLSDTTLIQPFDYIAITTDADFLKRNYTVMAPSKLIQVKTMPSYPNSEGTVIVTLQDSTIIDRFDYTEKMHSRLLSDVKGISLERRSFTMATQDASNWHSAAKSVGWSTPTYKNSQSYALLFSEEAFSIDPLLFSPDFDGYNDLLNIHYKLNESGMLCNITIFDVQGRSIRLLERNALMGTEGSFVWDGTNESGNRCQIGNYIVYIDAYNTQGKRQQVKKVVTLMMK